MKLLTVKDVAEMLQFHPRTVYDHAADFGGFYPAGLRALRFREDVINAYMEGQGTGTLAVSVRVPKATNHHFKLSVSPVYQGIR